MLGKYKHAIEIYDTQLVITLIQNIWFISVQNVYAVPFMLGMLATLYDVCVHFSCTFLHILFMFIDLEPFVVAVVEDDMDQSWKKDTSHGKI